METRIGKKEKKIGTEKGRKGNGREWEEKESR